MKAHLWATVSALALCQAAQAADMPVKAPYPAPVVSPSWTGWYVGIQGGVAEQRGRFNDPDGFLAGSFGSIPRNFSVNETGGAAGAHLGYNVQSGRFVFGLETDVNGVWAKATSTFRLTPLSSPSQTSFDLDWLATFRGRAGIAVLDSTLLYVTGGLAVGHVKDSAFTPSPAGPFSRFMNVDKTKTGWVVGGGIEQMLAQNWTVRAEVSYVNLGHSTATCTPNTNVDCVFPYRGELSNKLLMGMVGASLKF